MAAVLAFLTSALSAGQQIPRPAPVSFNLYNPRHKRSSRHGCAREDFWHFDRREDPFQGQTLDRGVLGNNFPFAHTVREKRQKLLFSGRKRAMADCELEDEDFGRIILEEDLYNEKSLKKRCALHLEDLRKYQTILKSRLGPIN